MPVVPLRGLVVMPYTLLSFDAGRDKSVAAIENAAENDGLVFLTAQKDPKLTDITAKQLYEIGCICKIKQVIKLPGDTVRVMAEGVCRALVDGFTGEEPFFSANLYSCDDEEQTDPEASSLRPLVSKKCRDYLELIGVNSLSEAFEVIEKSSDDTAYIFRLANITIEKIRGSAVFS